MTGIPSTETIWLKYLTAKGTVYYITSKANRDFYFIYRVDGNKAIKLGKSPNPTELEENYIEKGD